MTFLDGTSKNPDFKVTGQNKVIELFGDYWHKDDDPNELVEMYKTVGVDCLVIWENELNNNVEDIMKRVAQFIEGGG